jgi:putative oxidoreductase
VSGLERLAPLADLTLRLWVANVFFASGLTKIESFDTTVQLFTYEYQVPLLSPLVAAYVGTFVELFFPVLLALGLGGRLAALVLFAFNIVAVISYPDLNPAGLEQHYVWGLMLLVTLAHGPGKLSLDHLIARLSGR